MRKRASEIIRNLEMRIARLERQATRKVAGHIVLSNRINKTLLKRDLENTSGVEDLDLEDGVLTFLMDKWKNSRVETEVRNIAKKFKVKFEKGEFTDGLGMVYTANRRRYN